MRFIVDATDEIARHQHAGMVIVLESTTYPGTTTEVLVPKLTENGFELGKDVFVAFSPERVDPGNAVFKTRNTPKVIGGATPACLEHAVALYSHIIEKVVPVSSTETAEMVKLLENTFRAVNIGLVNEVAIMSRRLGIDAFEVIRAAATKPFGFMPFYPGPGLGGHCIPIDPLYLSWKLRTLKYQARFIELADSDQQRHARLRRRASRGDAERGEQGRPRLARPGLRHRLQEGRHGRPRIAGVRRHPRAATPRRARSPTWIRTCPRSPSTASRWTASIPRRASSRTTSSSSSRTTRRSIASAYFAKRSSSSTPATRSEASSGDRSKIRSL